MSQAPLNGISIEGVRAELRARPLRLSSEGRTWSGVALDEYGGYHVEEMLADPRDHPVITMCMAGSPYVLQERAGARHESVARRGEATIMPAGLETRWRGFLPAHLCMRVAPEVLEQVAADFRPFGRGSVALENRFRAVDPVLQHIAAMFDAELGREEHPAQALFMDSLATTLAVHLLRLYSAQGLPEERSAVPAQAAIRRALDWIAANPHRPLQLSELAEAAGLSRFHFSRLFKAEVGISPGLYVERCRIERAKALIRTAEAPIAEIAIAVGFADQAHFTRRFRRHVGQTPGSYWRENARRARPTH